MYYWRTLKKFQIYSMKIVFNIQLINDSLNSSDILSTSRFIKIHGYNLMTG